MEPVVGFLIGMSLVLPSVIWLPRYFFYQMVVQNFLLLLLLACVGSSEFITDAGNNIGAADAIFYLRDACFLFL